METTHRQSKQLKRIELFSRAFKVGILIWGIVLIFFASRLGDEGPARYFLLFTTVCFVCAGIEIVWISNVKQIANAWLNGMLAVVLVLAVMTVYVLIVYSPPDATWFFAAMTTAWMILISIEALLKKRAKTS